MKNFVRAPLFLIFILILVLACTKAIDFKTEVEFSITEQHQAEGYVNEDLHTTVTVVPEALLEEFSYSYSYSISKGDGYFRDVTGEIFSENENIALNPLSVSMMYVGSKPGEHIVKVIATDNYGFTEEVQLDYALAEIPPVIWTATSPVKRIKLGNSVLITLIFEKSQANSESNYERRYRVVSGSGTFTELSEQAEIDLEGFRPIAPGTYLFNFTPDALGTMELVFDLRGDDDSEFTAKLDFEVLEEIVDRVDPEINLIGDNPLTVQRGSNYTDPGATATDDVDGDISGNIVVDASDVDMAQIGTYRVTYNVKDKAGNDAIEVVRRVEVIAGDNPQSTENDILSFALPGQGEAAVIDGVNHAVTVNVPFGTDTNVAPIALSVSPDAIVSPSVSEKQNFGNPVAYTVTAENGDKQEWTVSVIVAESDEKDITEFEIEGVQGILNGTVITIVLPSGNDEKSLSPTILHTGESISPASGASLDFTNPVPYTITAENGSQKTYTASVTVEGDRPTANAVADPMTALLGQNINFTGSTSTDDIAIAGYEWDFGDGTRDISANPTHTYTSHGTYTVTLTVTDDGGLTDVISLEVEVPNQAPTAMASTTGNVDNITSPVTVGFKGSDSTDDVGVISYAWNFGDGTTSNLADPSHYYDKAGSYEVKLTVSDGEFTDTITMLINVRPYSGITGRYSAPSGSIVTVDLKAYGDGIGTVYVSVYTGSNRSGSLLKRVEGNLMGGSFNGNVIASENFVMPSNGVVYFYGEYTDKQQTGVSYTSTDVRMSNGSDTFFNASDFLGPTSKIPE